MKNDTQKFGLQPLKEDHRDFQLGAVFSLPALEDLPDKFAFETLGVKDQGNSDLCSAFAVTTLSEIQEGVRLSPLYHFALSKEISGDPDNWGQNARDAVAASAKYGDVEESEAKFKENQSSSNAIRHLKNWPEDHLEKAIKHKKKSYFKVTGLYDHFDNIRASMWKFRDGLQGVSLGLLWAWHTGQEFLSLENAGAVREGHLVAVVGFEKKDGEDYLIIQNSWGTDAGNGGLHYVARNVVNKYAPMFGAYMMVDLSKEEAQYMIENGIIDTDNWLIQLLKAIINFIKNII